MAVRAGWESTASVTASGGPEPQDPRRSCFICDDDPASFAWRPAWRSAVYRGRYVDAAGYERPALVKAFRTPTSFQREVAGLSVAGLMGAGPALLSPDGLRWSDRARFRLPDGSAIGEGALLVCEEDAGASLRVLIDERARWLADGGAPAEDRAREGSPVLLARLSPDGWGRLCDKILVDLCEQVEALHNGLNAGRSPLVHGDIKPENVCVGVWGPRPEDARATLIDFESAGRATQGAMARRPSTPRYRAYLAGVADPRSYDAGCVALVCYELLRGALPAPERFSDWEAFGELPTSELLSFGPLGAGVREEGRCALGDPGRLLDVAARAARRLGLSGVDDRFTGKTARGIARRHMGRRAWVDQKDLREIGSDLAMEFTEYGAYCQKIAQAISACYNLAVRNERWDRVQITAEDDPAIYAQNFDQAEAWFGYLTDELGLEVTRAGDETGERVEQLRPAELARLMRLEHERWLVAKREQGWRGMTPADEDRLRSELGSEGAADSARRKRLLDSWKVNELMRPWDQLTEDEQYMTRAMIENMVPVLSELGISVCRG